MQIQENYEIFYGNLPRIRRKKRSQKEREKEWQINLENLKFLSEYVSVHWFARKIMSVIQIIANVCQTKEMAFGKFLLGKFSIISPNCRENKN